MSTNQDEVAVNRNDDFLIASDSEDIVFTTCDNFNAATNNDRCGVSTTTFRKSCNSCSRSKKKCLLSPNSSICTGCKRLNISCIFAYKRKSGPQPNKKKILSEPNTYDISGTSTDGEDSLSTSEHSDSNEQQLYGQESKKPLKNAARKLLLFNIIILCKMLCNMQCLIAMLKLQFLLISMSTTTRRINNFP